MYNNHCNNFFEVLLFDRLKGCLRCIVLHKVDSLLVVL